MQFKGLWHRARLQDLGRGRQLTARGFLTDRRGNYALMTAVAMVPLMGGLAIAVDFGEMNRQKQTVANALDAAGIATARQVVSGASETQLIAYAKSFFEANLGSVNPTDTVLTVTLPSNQAGGGTLKLSARLNYKPIFFPVFADLAGHSQGSGSSDISFTTKTEIRLKNTLEVALVLDNSGSMSNLGSGAGQKRIDLLKAAAKQLVDTLAQQAALIKQVDKPVQFSLVPFAASVNVGPENAGASWMDVDGLSPVHQENFDWSVMSTGEKRAEKINGVWYKKGTGWGEEENQVLSRFSLYKDMRHVSSREWVATGQEYVCTRYRDNGTCRTGHWQETGYYNETITEYASWQGCVEARPYPYNTTDAPASGGSQNTGIGFGDPATMFVPMFAPDEPGDRWATEADENPDGLNASQQLVERRHRRRLGRQAPEEHEQVFRGAAVRRDVAAGNRAELQLHDRTHHAAHRCQHARKDWPPSRRRSTGWRRTATPTSPKASPGAGERYRAASRSARGGRMAKRATTRSSSFSPTAPIPTPCLLPIRRATSRPTRPTATCSPATTAPASDGC